MTLPKCNRNFCFFLIKKNNNLLLENYKGYIYGLVKPLIIEKEKSNYI